MTDMNFGGLPILKTCTLCSRGFLGEPSENHCSSCKSRLAALTDKIVEAVLGEIVHTPTSDRVTFLAKGPMVAISKKYLDTAIRTAVESVMKGGGNE